MSCNIKYDDLIFSIQKVSRFNTNEYYVFIGDTDQSLSNIFKKLENRQGINKDEIILLKKNYPEYYTGWINIVKNKIKIKFIAYKIHIDDSINEIRNKIFIFLSNPESKSYILPKNQELWLETTNKNRKIIGYYYENSKIKKKIYTTPHLFNPSKIDDEFLKDTDKKRNNSENNMLIYDLLNDDNYIKTTIYLSDAKDEEEFLKSKKIDINKSFIEGYFKKYWPYVDLSYNYEDIKNNYLLTKEYYLRENYIFNLIKNIEKDNNIFGSCNMLTIKLNVNDDDEEINNQNNFLIEKYVDLYPIFDYLREDKIDEKTPFIKYSEDILEAPFSIISKKALDNNRINKDILREWLGITKDVQRRTNSISIKRYIKDYNNEPRYSSLSLSKSGKIEINISFHAYNNANFNDVELTIKDCKKFVEELNKNRIIKKKNEKQKISPPDMDIVDNRVNFKNNTKILYMNIAIPLNLDKPLDFKKLLEFSKKFPYFLAEFPKNLLKKTSNDEKELKSIKLKYKRVSLFANMNDILLDIDILKQSGKDTLFILKFLEKKYQKNIDEVKKYLIEWERKYSSSKSSKVSSESKPGITVIISNSNITLTGLTKVYQVPLLYNFFVGFLELFINYENYLKKTDFKKIFMNKNLNIEYKEEVNEIDKDVSLELNQIYNLNNYNNNIFIDENSDEFIRMNEEINNQLININQNIDISESNEAYNNNKKIVGLASNDEIGTDIRLVCKDAIPEKDTCADFCNDKKYFLRRLQRYDNKLFKFKVDKKNKQSQYSRGCQQANKQPVVLPYDPETNPKIKRDSYTFAVKYSSDPNSFQRWYVCPRIWCPYCEIPISEADVDPKSIRIRSVEGGQCKTAICPFGNHQIFMRDQDKKAWIYPGFLSNLSPKGLCLPCCFVLSQDNPKSASYSTFKKCMGDEVEDVNIKNGQIYILGKGIPIEKDRYGKIPVEIARILKTNLDTGYLNFQKGYLRKGVKHFKNNSFLSAIADVLSCDKENLKIDIYKIKNLLIEKLNETIFRSIYNGNLENTFHNPKSRLSPLENFKNYILNEFVEIDHKYLWDFLQRPNILFENGVNIFIFSNNNLLCPLGENIKYFYDITKKSVLLVKHNDYYEPIYYLEGDGKGTSKKLCIFNNDKEEIRKLFEISYNGCKFKFDIDWVSVLKDNIKKYDLKIDNITINLGDNLQDTLNEILTNIQNNKLDNKYLPNLQYIDTYSKVFGIKLNNGLYIPTSPSKLITQLKYKIVDDVSQIDKISLNEVLKYSSELSNKTKLKCKITHKILDIKNMKNIIALVNENNRFIPIKEILNKDKTLKISNINYFSDIDEALENKIQIHDKRVEQINKKNFEDETYIRMKFELSKFLQIKDNKTYFVKILDIINSEDTDIIKNRKEMYGVLNGIFKEIISTNNRKFDYGDYKTPNKRIPCFLKNKLNKNIKLSCESDPHCVSVNNSCKLYVNKKNLLDNHRNFDNYDYYVSKIVDELLRFKMKRNEIINDNIPNIINKEIIEENPNKYIIIHTLNNDDISNIVENIFRDNKGIFIDNRNLYEEISTQEISFKKDKYLIADKTIIRNNKIEDLCVYWDKLLGDKFKVKLTNENDIFTLLPIALNSTEFKDKMNEELTINTIKSKIVNYIKKIIDKKINNITNATIIELYSKESNKIFKYVTSIESLLTEILGDNYMGSELELNFISKIFNINFIIIDKRLKKDKAGYKLIITDPSNKYIILYKYIVHDTNKYYLIQNKNTIIFKLNDFPQKFINVLNKNKLLAE